MRSILSAPGSHFKCDWPITNVGCPEHADGGITTTTPVDQYEAVSGTSFSTPNVVGALCEIIELNDCTAKQALEQLVKRRGLFRIPDYGVVVNRSF